MCLFNIIIHFFTFGTGHMRGKGRVNPGIQIEAGSVCLKSLMLHGQTGASVYFRCGALMSQEIVWEQDNKNTVL